jgi:hypothetical protein
MGYQPRHAAQRAVDAARRLSWGARAGVAAVAVAGLAGGGAVLAGGAGAATASFAAPSGAGVVTEIVLDNGGYTKCLNDYKQNVSAGAPIALYTCSATDPGSQWLTYPDNTIRPYRAPGMALTANANNHLVLESVTGSTAQTWYFDSSGMLVNGETTAGQTNYVLNDPGYNTANGTQAIIWNQAAITTNAHWYVTKARYGSASTLSNRPDSGGGGNNWANDHMTRQSMVVYMGDQTAGTHTYQGSVSDTGTFSALAGELTPNQGADPGLKLGDSLGGTLYGRTGSGFTTDQWVSRGPGASYSGSNPATGTWYELFFPAGTTFGGSGIDNDGPMQWAWSYASSKDDCGNIEHWVDASYSNSGQSATAGDITAPASCTG